MGSVNIIYCCQKKLSKDSNELQREIIKAIENLSKRITEYFNQGISFEHIVNDDHVKYDKHGYFYTYKHRGKNNMQLRVLYACVQDEENTCIIVADYLQKKTSQRCLKENHLYKFSSYDNLSLSDFCLSNKITCW